MTLPLLRARVEMFRAVTAVMVSTLSMVALVVGRPVTLTASSPQMRSMSIVGLFAMRLRLSGATTMQTETGKKAFVKKEMARREGELGTGSRPVKYLAKRSSTAQQSNKTYNAPG